ncbi:MAG: winged helix-turn-helix transcriptional regulator [Anaerococcus hydrogenalis]|nr:winged helix-turn-helix transcriptional regulator [Anaerococcus hydrogenalis]PMC81287.1 ArsR family transcriptional regulator [Anaerococcus hydrogenalis]
MGDKYVNISKKLKVLSDPKRLEIVDMLSCEELCACEILEKFDISQPTLSSDMKKLEDANIIKSRKEGKNVFYIVNNESLKELEKLLGQIFESSPDCICKE